MWDVLAIAPTDDPKAIRRAYAARLKQIDPDRDRETFAQLRRALEWALAGAAQPANPPADQAPAEGGRPAVTAPAAPLRQDRSDLHLRSAASASPGAAERARDRILLIDLESALQRGDAGAASQLYVRAAAVGALPLGDAARMQARLFAVALEDQRLDGAAFRELARTCGWDKSRLDAIGSDLHERVGARLAAEDWYEALVARADGRSGRAQNQVNAARLVLRRIRRPWLFGIERHELAACLQEYWAHKAWVADRIDPAWVMRLEDRIAPRDSVAENRGSALMPLLAVLYVIALIFVFSQRGFAGGLLFLVPIAVIGLLRLRSNDS